MSGGREKKMKRLTAILLIGSQLLLAACAATTDGGDILPLDGQTSASLTLDEMTTRLAQAEICCSSLAEISYKPIVTTETVKVNMGQDGQVFRLPTGKSYVAGFFLPDKPEGFLQVTITAPVGKTVFAPNVLLLDEQYQPVRSYGFADLVFQKGGLFSTDHYQLQLTISEHDFRLRQTRYMLIYTTAALLRSGLRVDRQQAMESAQRIGNESSVLHILEHGEYIPHAPDGVVKIDFVQRQSVVAGQATDRAVQQEGSAASQPEIEQLYKELIDKYIEDGEYEKAFSLMERAAAAGYSGVRPWFIQRVKAGAAK